MYAAYLCDAGYRPIEAGNPDDALPIATASPPDVVVTDLMLPGSMSGLELTRHLQRDARTKHVPVVVLTGMGRSQDREVAISAGAEAFLLKPGSPRALADRIQRVLTGLSSPAA